MHEQSMNHISLKKCLDVSKVTHNMHTFSTHYLQSGEDHKVTQFQMSGWTAEGLCTSPSAVMAVIEQVLVIQRRTGNKPIVVHGR